MNTMGKIYRLTTFGESHGKVIGGIIDGCPAGIELDFDQIQMELDRRKPGQSKIVTQRKESDTVQFLSGIYQGKTAGTPIGFIIPNENQRSVDYSHIENLFRPSHADYTYHKKYGIRDPKGGGRTSARETANWVVAGAVAKQVIPNIKINAYVSSVGDLFLEKPYQDLDFSRVESNIVRCPDEEIARQMIEKIEQTRKEGDTIGGTITCVIQNVPIGLGEPIFDKLHARLGQAMLS
ncbi:MAG: chorismate synthase, partial [Moheibacter sp.]